MNVPEKGVVYRASPWAYIGNYLIGVGVIFLAFLVVRSFNIAFSLDFSSLGNIFNTLVYFAFGGVAAWLFAEPFWEGFVRQYAISNSGVVKIEGFIWKRRHSIPFQSVAEVKVTKGLFGRIFNYGTVEVAGANEGSFYIRHVTNPDEIHRIVQHRAASSVRGGVVQNRRISSAGRKEDKDGLTEE